MNNALFLDLEKGAEFVECARMDVKGIWPPVGETPEQKEARSLANNGEGYWYLTEAGAAIAKAGNPYEYLIIDTVTKLEEWCEWEATEDYMKSSIGKNYNVDENTGLRLPRAQWQSVLQLPKGAGYLYLRESFKKWIERLSTLADTLIIVCHLKDKYIDKGGKEVTAKDLDLTGKLKNIISADADAIGYLYRDDESKLKLNFQSSDEILCGARPAHLRGQDLILATPNEAKDGIKEVFWDKVFIK